MDPSRTSTGPPALRTVSWRAECRGWLRHRPRGV